MVRRACDFALFCAAFIACVGCKHTPRQHAAAAGSGSAAAVPRLAPLVAANWLVDLEVPGFGAAKVAVPVGARSPRPIVIALHGVADRPEWACGAFRGIAGAAPFVLCPRGVLRKDLSQTDVRYTFGSADDTSRELRASLTALKHTYGAHVAPGPVVFGGFEIGADHAALIARQEPAFFSRLLLIENDSAAWPPSEAALFGRQGGVRVLFADTSPRHQDLLVESTLTRRGGADAQALYLSRPDLEPNVINQLAEHWDWLSAPPAADKPAPQNLAGNALSAGGPVTERPAP